jgi:hypothetical protein
MWEPIETGIGTATRETLDAGPNSLGKRRVPENGLRGAPEISEVADIVRRYNARYGEMDKVMWYVSSASKRGLLQRTSTKALPELVGLVRRWWGV